MAFALACSFCHRRYHTTGRRLYAAYYSTKSDRPKPFLNSEAHNHRVLNEYVLTPEEQRKGRFGIPIGLTLFAFIIYVGWIREYGEKDKKKMEYLTRDISDRIPPAAYKKFKKEEEEEEQEKLLKGKGIS